MISSLGHLPQSYMPPLRTCIRSAMVRHLSYPLPIAYSYVLHNPHLKDCVAPFTRTRTTYSRAPDPHSLCQYVGVRAHTTKKWAHAATYPLARLELASG